MMWKCIRCRLSNFIRMCDNNKMWVVVGFIKPYTLKCVVVASVRGSSRVSGRSGVCRYVGFAVVDGYIFVM